jgi:hypothetical protein
MARVKKSPLPEDREFSKQCAWIDSGGHQCQHYGSMSSDTTGHGPWFCGQHFFDTKGKKLPPVDMAEIDERVNKIVSRRSGESEHDWSMRCRDYVVDFVKKPFKKPSNDWAFRIMKEHAAGAKFPHLSLQYAREVTGIMDEQSEPGELG